MAEWPPQSADADNTKAQQRNSLAWRLTIVGAGLLALGVLGILLLACVLWIPKSLYPPLRDTDLHSVSDAAKVQELKDTRLTLENDARTTLLQGLGGLLVLTGAAIGAIVTLRQVRATRDQIRATAEASQNQLKLSYKQVGVSEQGQVTDRYTKAIDQLDDKKALAVRLGGLYALERIAQDSPDDRITIAEVLCAYVRTAARPKPAVHDAKDTTQTGTAAAEPVPLAVRAPDVQAAVTILGRWWKRMDQPPPALDLSSAELQDADLFQSRLRETDFTLAQLQRANLGDAVLQRSFLGGAQLQGANLSGAQLQGADLSGAQLQGADLSGAQLQSALASKATRWPEGWNHDDARAAGVQFVDLSSSLVPGDASANPSQEPSPPPEE